MLHGPLFRCCLSRLAVLGALVASAAGPPATAADVVPTQEVEVIVEKLAGGLSHPWSVEPLPDGSILVTERSGEMHLFRDGKLSKPIAGMPEVLVEGQGGLLDVALANDFASSRVIFLSYSAGTPAAAGTAIARATLSADMTSLQQVTEIFRMNRPSATHRHFGSRIAVATDGTLFFSIGDRGKDERAQDWSDHAGAVLRINPDGSIPPDNPRVGSDAPEVWSKGHRNPQGLAFDSETGELFEIEHGARGGDEVNLPRAGANYGWPTISYGRHYSGAEIGIGTAADGYEQPIHYWDPSIAPGGMAVYRGRMFPEWNGDLLVAALKFQLLARLHLDAETREVLGEERILKGHYGRIRDVGVDADGAVLVVTDEEDGALLRISRSPVAEN
ncbi:PQQ-dependent sugar dehydrogenase [Hoeflea marina]